jgi:thiosulfate/3-mercaptopyruvate sulfurtransferase
MTTNLPILLEPSSLANRLDDEDILLVDLCRPETYARNHIPGAVHLDYGQIVTARPPVGGLLPSAAHFSAVMSAIGLTGQKHLVAYDEEGGGMAGRLVWTLHAFGHRRASVLDGGLHSWAGEERPLGRELTAVRPSDYRAEFIGECVAERDYILSRLGQADLALLDARSPAEYLGRKVYAALGGHIPGAANLDWTDTMDRSRHLRLKPAAELRAMLDLRGVTPDKEVIVYCQTHHRSSLSYLMLKALGYENVKGYPGSWSEWGNIPDSPVER